MISSNSNSPSQLTTLDVIGVGLSVEMFDQLKIVEKIEKHPKASILPPDPDRYPTDYEVRKFAMEERSANVLTTALKKSVEQWSVPSIGIWPFFHNEDVPHAGPNGSTDYFDKHIEIISNAAKIPEYKFTPIPPHFSDNPEETLEFAFQFFENFPDVPMLLIFATDGDTTREIVNDQSRNLHWQNGTRRFDSMAETAAVLLLARRERVDTFIRPYAKSQVTALYAKESAQTGFVPSQFLPECWSTEQLDQFDKLPTLAVLHRPIRINYRDGEDDKTRSNKEKNVKLISTVKRHEIFKAGLDTVLQSNAEITPIRIFYDTGGSETGGHVVPLTMAAPDLLPKLDLSEPMQAIDISQRIGNTGAASPFVLWILAAMATSDEQTSSITVNLRQREEATITLVTTDLPTKAEAMRGRIPLGTKINCLVEACPQTGHWLSTVGNERLFMRKGEVVPRAAISRKLSFLQKMKGELDFYEVETAWVLVDYEEKKETQGE